MGLSAIEVDPTEEQKREESQLLKDLQEKNYTDPWLSGTHPILEDFFWFKVGWKKIECTSIDPYSIRVIMWVFMIIIVECIVFCIWSFKAFLYHCYVTASPWSIMGRHNRPRCTWAQYFTKYENHRHCHKFVSLRIYSSKLVSMFFVGTFSGTAFACIELPLLCVCGNRSREHSLTTLTTLRVMCFGTIEIYILLPVCISKNVNAGIESYTFSQCRMILAMYCTTSKELRNLSGKL